MRKQILFYIIISTSLLLVKCNSDTGKANQDNSKINVTAKDTVAILQGINSKGIGRFKDVKLTHPLDQDMIAKAGVIYNSKCIACHKLTQEKLVGPGWKGITNNRQPEWIMNFITNTQVMLDKDLLAQSDLITCVVRMPNQDLSDEQARQMLEFMRNNDGEK